MNEDKAPERVWEQGFKECDFCGKLSADVAKHPCFIAYEAGRASSRTPPVATAEAEEVAIRLVMKWKENNAKESSRIQRDRDLCNRIAAALAAATERGYEQAKEDAAKDMEVVAREESLHETLADGMDMRQSSEWHKGRRAILTERAKSIRALAPAPSSPDEQKQEVEA